MSLLRTRATSGSRRGRGRRMAVASAAVVGALGAGALALNTLPASAASTAKEAYRWDASQQKLVRESNMSRVTFIDWRTPHFNESKLDGSLVVGMGQDGHWALQGRLHNKKVAWRNASPSCTLEYDNAHRVIEFSHPRRRINGNSSRNFDTGWTYHREIEDDWDLIRRTGHVTCHANQG